MAEVENKPTEVKSENHGSPQPTNGLAVAALVTGLLGMGLVPIVLGILGLKKPGGRGMSIAGIVLGALSVLLTIAVIAMFVIGFGFAANEASKVQNTVEDYKTEQQEKIDSKKEFSKGETALFGDLEVKASVTNTNFTPEASYLKPASGKKFIVVTMDIKNTGDKTDSVSSYSFKLEDSKGVISNTSYIQPAGKELGSVSLAAGGETSGEVVYEVASDATSFKLVYEEYAYNFGSSKSENIKYSLTL